MLRLLLKLIVMLSAIVASESFAGPLLHKTSVADLLGNPLLVSTRQQSIPVYSFNAAVKDVVRPAQLTTLDEPRFLIQGGLHGDEVLTSEFVIWLADRAASGKSLLNKISKNIAIDFVPYANPDAFAKSRYNRNSVNLNRNFGILWGVSREPNGPFAFSESETQAIRALVTQRRYVAAIDVHGYVNWVVSPSHPRYLKQVDPLQVARFQDWRNAMRANLPILGKYELKTAAVLGDGGAFEDWAFWSNNTLSLCLEMQSASRHLTQGDEETDTFLRYESFIYRMFVEALKIEQKIPMERIPSSQLAEATAVP